MSASATQGGHNKKHSCQNRTTCWGPAASGSVNFNRI